MSGVNNRCYERLFFLLAIVVLTFFVCSCSSIENKVEMIPATTSVDFSGSPYLNLNDLMEEVNANRVEAMQRKEAFNGFEDYLKHRSGEVKISKDELDLLLNSRGKDTQRILINEAIYDVDLYFLALKYGYGGYYYFGEENFEKAREEVLSEISVYNSVSVDSLIQSLRNSLKFVRDGHFSIDHETSIDDEDFRYEYYYSGLELGKDDFGYYLLDDETKWYCMPVDNPYVRVAPFLTESGYFTYSLFQFCPVTVAHENDILKLFSDEETREINVTWTISEPYSEESLGLDFKLVQDEGLSYVSIRSFSSQKYFDELKRYSEKDAGKIRNSTLLIYDTRSNNGGADMFPRNWIKNLTGSTPAYKNIVSSWYNYLWSDDGYGNEHYSNSVEKGKTIANSIPIFFLTDDRSGSSGESVLLFTRTLENCLVIGSNSSGCQLCGNVKEFFLPNSGIRVSFSQCLEFANEMTSVEGRGYEPDVWCNPKTALSSVAKMLVNYGFASSDLVDSFFEEITTDDNIYFEYPDDGERVTSGLGARRGKRIFNIVYHDIVVSDYLFSNSDDSIIRVEKNDSGQLIVTQVGNGYSTITITIGDKVQQFGFHGGD